MTGGRYVRQSNAFLVLEQVTWSLYNEGSLSALVVDSYVVRT